MKRIIEAGGDFKTLKKKPVKGRLEDEKKNADRATFRTIEVERLTTMICKQEMVRNQPDSGPGHFFQGLKDRTCIYISRTIASKVLIGLSDCFFIKSEGCRVNSSTSNSFKFIFSKFTTHFVQAAF